jgi:hypothetical protein
MLRGPAVSKPPQQHTGRFGIAFSQSIFPKSNCVKAQPDQYNLWVSVNQDPVWVARSLKVYSAVRSTTKGASPCAVPTNSSTFCRSACCAMGSPPMSAHRRRWGQLRLIQVWRITPPRGQPPVATSHSAFRPATVSSRGRPGVPPLRRPEPRKPKRRAYC